MKHLSLGDSGRRVDLGGEVRLQYERLDYPAFGAGPTDRDGYLLTRALLHADLHLTPALRVFAQVRSAGESGRSGGARTTDRDDADVSQLFVDLALRGDVYALSGAPRAGSAAVRVRVGRQELAFGASRVVSLREGPNLRRTFDGVRVGVRIAGTTIDAIAAHPTRPGTGRFDDASDSTRTLYGVYAVRPFIVARPGTSLRGVDAYMLRLDRSQGQFAQGSAAERRFTAGTRLWRRGPQWDADIEGMLQWGRFGSDAIRAHAIIADVGYTARVRTAPRVGLRASMSSGDRDSTKSSLQSLNPVFPRAFVVTAPIGPVNLINLHPTVEFLLHRHVSLLLDDDHFWRSRISDGLYDAAGVLVRGPGLTSARYYGHQVWAQLDVALSRHLRSGIAAGRFFTGAALKERQPSRDLSFALLTSTYTF